MDEKVKLVQKLDDDHKFDIFKIEAGAIKNVNIPCLLALPENLKEHERLMLIFNNENGQTLDASVENMQKELPHAVEALKLDSPFVIPILPSQAEFKEELKQDGLDFFVGEPKQFARECFDSRIPSTNRFYRLDEQISTLIKNILNNRELKDKIEAQREDSTSIEFNDKLVGFGHSGAGAAMLRFSLLHPELLDTLIIGGNGDIVPTPIGENAEKLGYPFGIKDYEELFGREFSGKDFKGINFQFYIGDREDENPIYDTIRDSNYIPGKTGPNFAPKDLADKYKSLYGNSFFERFQHALQQYENNGINLGLQVYKDDCHSVIHHEDLHSILDGKNFDEIATYAEGISKNTSSFSKKTIYDCKYTSTEVGKATVPSRTVTGTDKAQKQVAFDEKDFINSKNYQSLDD